MLESSGSYSGFSLIRCRNKKNPIKKNILTVVHIFSFLTLTPSEQVVLNLGFDLEIEFGHFCNY